MHSNAARRTGFLDPWLGAADGLLKTLAGAHRATRLLPSTAPAANPSLSTAEKNLSGALMRVNHVGEVCAQALYTAQALSTRDADLRDGFHAAARDEIDHLAWTEQRLRELGTHTSRLNLLWYAGAFGIGWVAGRIGGDRYSLGFVVETERQVEEHLARHLERLPQTDTRSRDVVSQMKDDEARHADEAQAAGGQPLPVPLRLLMRAAAKVMTTVAHRV